MVDLTFNFQKDSGFLSGWHTGLAGFLVRVHVLVCLFEQGMVVCPVRCQAAAERETEGDVQVVAQTGAAVVLQFRQGADGVGERRLRLVLVEKQDKLVAAKPCGGAVTWCEVRQKAGKLSEVSIAALMALRIIDHFQVVSVYHHKSAFAEGFRFAEAGIEEVFQSAAVVQSGQKVIIPLPLDPQTF